jgi:SAM-dependent methyltransferase
MSSYLQTVETVYAAAAAQPDTTLCCTAAPAWRFPDLVIPPAMLAMNYGCGTTVDPRDLKPTDTILYVGVGGGLEALQFAYFTRRAGGVIAVDPVAAMRAKAAENFEEAARLNSWFRPDFVTVLDGNALALPLADDSVTVAAQNCLFNVFQQSELNCALGEVFRVLQLGGKFIASDPITPVPLPAAFRADEVVRARCLSGCMTLDKYLAAVTGAGFGRVEIRSRSPYRGLSPHEYPAIGEPVLLESIEIAAAKFPDGPDGPEIFSGRTATYVGPDRALDDGFGNALPRGLPQPVSDAAARRLAQRGDILVSAPTYHSRGGCC